MIRNYLIIIYISLISLFFSGIHKSHAETVNTEIAASIDSLYRARNFSALENYSLRQLAFSDSLTNDDFALIHKTLGIAYIIEGRVPEGRNQFKLWLKYAPNGYLDSFNFPPHIIRIYEEIKAEMTTVEPQSTPVSVQKWKPKSSGIAGSLILPGWGQFDKNEKKKGVLMFLTQSVFLTGWLAAEHNFELADRAYHQETNFTEFDDKYDKANNWNRARWTALIAAVSTYIFIQTDYYLHPPTLNLANNISIKNSTQFSKQNTPEDFYFSLPISLVIDF